jgi:SEFIR domain
MEEPIEIKVGESASELICSMSGKTVFISYSFDSDEHCERVLALSERLRHDGIETCLDQYVNGSPRQGWPRWMLDQLDAAGSVLVVCTETYYRRFRGHEEPAKGRGVDWEGALITQEIYDSRSQTLKFVPVFLSAAVEAWVPEPLRSVTHYALTSQSAYQRLYDFLLGQAGVEPSPVGVLKRTPRQKGTMLTFAEPPPSEAAKPLKPLDDVGSLNTGIHLLKDLITEVPAIADALSRSKEVIESTYRQVGNLELYKIIHDALHNIEFECLRPMQEGGAVTRLRPFKVRFDLQARRILEGIQGREITTPLRDDLLDRLNSIAVAFQASVDTPCEAAYGCAVGELNGLLSGVSPQLDYGISVTATELNLDRLVELMTTVRGRLPESPAAHDPALEVILQSIDALNRLRDELARRVSEHGHLQRLDSKLRTACVGGTLPGALAIEWERIKLVRSRLAPPFSLELSAANDDLVAIESEIEVGLERPDEQAARDLLREYFRSVSSVFRDVDVSLKVFCGRLSAVNQPLKTVLNMF